MTQPPIDVASLRNVAKAATQGSWEVQDGCSWRRIGTLGHNGNVLCPTNHPRDHHPDLCAGRGEDVQANLRHIATFDPPTVLALLARIEELEGEKEEGSSVAGLPRAQEHAQAQSPAGWRDIASAPKDETILLFCPRGDGNPGSTFRVTVGDWCDDPGGTTVYRDADGRWTGQDDRDGFTGWMSWDGGFSEETMMPTHWMPLPAPPCSHSQDGTAEPSSKPREEQKPCTSENGFADCNFRKEGHLNACHKPGGCLNPTNPIEAQSHG